jgi:hypothetical protein
MQRVSFPLLTAFFLHKKLKLLKLLKEPKQQLILRLIIAIEKTPISSVENSDDVGSSVNGIFSDEN